MSSITGKIKEYYILINRKKVFAPYRTDRNETISWFQRNRGYLQKTYGDVSKAELVERVTEVHSSINMDLNHVKYTLVCYLPNEEDPYYITKTKSHMPIISKYREDMAEGDLLFENEFLAKRYAQMHEDILKSLYREDVIKTIKIEPVSEAEIIALRQSLKNRKVEDVI